MKKKCEFCREIIEAKGNRKYHKTCALKRERERRMEYYYNIRFNKPLVYKKIMERNKRYTKKNPKLRCKITRRYALKNPEKIKAHLFVSKYKIPLKKKCNWCGSIEKLERHHPDYLKPYLIFTLCKSCHANFHAGGK